METCFHQAKIQATLPSALNAHGHFQKYFELTYSSRLNESLYDSQYRISGEGRSVVRGESGKQ